MWQHDYLRAPEADHGHTADTGVHAQPTFNSSSHTKKGVLRATQATVFISRVTQADTENDTVVHTDQLTVPIKQTVCGAKKGRGQKTLGKVRSLGKYRRERGMLGP